ncbi:MAG: hypothetical protein RR665_03025, partial [Malacoplasma sp.]
KIIPTDHLGFIGKQYEPISDFFLEFRGKFEDEVNLIKKKVYSLSNCNKSHDKKNFLKFYNSIKNDLDTLENEIHEIDLIYDNVFDYLNYMSIILLGYREHSKSIIKFYEKNLMTNYDGYQITSCINKIKKNNIVINDFFAPQDPEKISEEIIDINKNLSDFWNLLNDIYIIDKEFKYINYSNDETILFLKNNSRNIDEQTTNLANKTLTKISSNFKSLTKKINEYNFEEAKEISNYIIFELLKIKKKLKLNFKSNEFLNKHKNSFLDLINNFLIQNKKIQKNIIKMSENFILDRDFYDEINNVLNNFYKVVNDVKDIKIDELSNSDELLKLTQNTLTKIVLWGKECNLILKEAKLKYKYFKIIFNEITLNKIIVALMMSFIINNKMENNYTYKNVFDLDNKLKSIEKNILENYSKNFEYHYNSLMDAKEEINVISEELTKIYLMKMYVEKIVWYLNLKIFISGTFIIDTTDILKLYDEGKYKESIYLTLESLKSIKKHHI